MKKKIVIGFLTLLSVYLLAYAGMGSLPLLLSNLHGDYPGPKVLSTQDLVPYATKSSQHIDWLLLHGASLDARVWTRVLKHNPQDLMVALSLSHHEDGVKYAAPGHQAALDIIKYLRTHHIKKGIVGHSTASLWIADAYSSCPECFNGLQIILLSPNVGSNIESTDIQTLQLLNHFSYVLPDTLLGGKISSCQGVNEKSYQECKKTYLYGRLLYVNSIRYYTDLVSYSQNPDTIKKLVYFLEHDRNNIKIYLAGDDHVLNLVNTEQFLGQHKIAYQVIPDTAHQMLLNNYNAWLPHK